MRFEKYLTHPDICEYRAFSTSVIPFSPAVVEACRSNACGRYGKTWTCPPGVGTLEELEARIKSYPNALLVSFKYDLEDSFDFEGMQEGHRRAKDAFREITDAMRSDGENFYALGNEGCGLCAECTYPDAPCRFPDRASPSIEACGVNVMQLSKAVGMRYINGANTVTYFCMVLW
ncbi:MAG: DUF2284 domain-containing protein [Clostridia bacterium]|nr:DUF2284 domain-containing protein [Clostridia bacterium]